MIIKHNTTKMIESFCDAGLFTNSGTAISLCYMLNLLQAEQKDIQLNKSQLITSVPHSLGSLTRKRAVLERLIRLGALYVEVGNKKSEKLVSLKGSSKELLLKELD